MNSCFVDDTVGSVTIPLPVSSVEKFSLDCRVATYSKSDTGYELVIGDRVFRVEATAEDMALLHSTLSRFGVREFDLTQPLQPYQWWAAGDNWSIDDLGPERKAEWNGGIYVIRDILRRGPAPNGVSFLRCEYATKDANGETVWKPCAEGVEFSTIEPFEKVA